MVTVDNLPKSKSNRKIFAFIIVIVLVLIGGGIYLLVNYRNSHNSKLLPYNKLAGQVSHDIVIKEFASAVNLIDAQPRTERASLNDQMLLASVYSAQGNYSQAISIYRNLLNSNPNQAGLAASAASAALQGKDYKDAVAWYKQAASLVINDKADVVRLSDQAYYNHQAELIQSGQLK